jgi:hypothetical protein
MKTIEFLRNFFTRWPEIHSSFLSYFPDFQKKNKISNLKKFKNYWVFKISNLKNHQILNIKNHQISNQYQKVDPTADKNISLDAFKIVL